MMKGNGELMREALSPGCSDPCSVCAGSSTLFL